MVILGYYGNLEVANEKMWAELRAMGGV